MTKIEKQIIADAFWGGEEERDNWDFALLLSITKEDSLTFDYAVKARLVRRHADGRIRNLTSTAADGLCCGVRAKVSSEYNLTPYYRVQYDHLWYVNEKELTNNLAYLKLIKRRLAKLERTLGPPATVASVILRFAQATKANWLVQAEFDSTSTYDSANLTVQEISEGSGAFIESLIEKALN